MASATLAREPQPSPQTASAAALELEVLEAWLASHSALQLPLHQIESQQQIKGREVQRWLLQAHLHHRGTGDVGVALRVRNDSGEVLYTHRRPQEPDFNRCSSSSAQAFSPSTGHVPRCRLSNGS